MLDQVSTVLPLSDIQDTPISRDICCFCCELQSSGTAHIEY